MPWKETVVKDQRIAFVVRAKQETWSISALCREFGISRKTGHKWLRRHAQEGSLSALEERSRRPTKSPRRTSSELEQRVVELRGQEGWGSRKLQWLLAQEHVHLARSTIDRILHREGLMDEREATYPATSRFERPLPNDLVQMDFKGEYQLADDSWCHPLSLIDDHSRFSLGLYALANQRGETVRQRLTEAFERYGVPTAMLVDHGCPWWSPTNGHGLTKLSVWLIRQGIQLHLSGIRHPQTQGKVERFHRTLDEAVVHWGKPETLLGFADLFAHFRSVYNKSRPHEALGMQTPASRYRSSPRPFQPEPPPWQYPEGSVVRKLNPAGCLCYRGHRYFVCEALAEEHVGCQTFADTLLITYRHMHVREINLETGRTRPIVEPLARPSKSSFGNKDL
jgi:transposase InsO family protein